MALDTSALGAATKSWGGGSRLPSLQELGGNQRRENISNMAKFGADFMLAKAKLANSIQENQAMMEYRRATLDQKQRNADRAYDLDLKVANRQADRDAAEDKHRTSMLDFQSKKLDEQIEARRTGNLTENLQSRIGVMELELKALNDDTTNLDTIVSSALEGDRGEILQEQAQRRAEIAQDRKAILAGTQTLVRLTTNRLSDQPFERVDDADKVAFFTENEAKTLQNYDEKEQEKLDRLSLLTASLENVVGNRVVIAPAFRKKFKRELKKNPDGTTRIQITPLKDRGKAVITTKNKVTAEIATLEKTLTNIRKLRDTAYEKALINAKKSYDLGIAPDYSALLRPDTFTIPKYRTNTETSDETKLNERDPAKWESGLD